MAGDPGANTVKGGTSSSSQAPCSTPKSIISVALAATVAADAPNGSAMRSGRRVAADDGAAATAVGATEKTCSASKSQLAFQTNDTSGSREAGTAGPLKAPLLSAA